MEFSERQKSVILDLIKIAWQAGAVRSEEQANELKDIKIKLLEKPELKAVE